MRPLLALSWALSLLALALSAERLLALSRLPPVPPAASEFDVGGMIKPLFVSQTDLVAVTPQAVLRGRLPALQERVVVPSDRRVGVIVSAASQGEAVGFTFHNGPEDWGWALLGPMGWIVPPQHLFDATADARKGVYLTEEAGKMSLVTVHLRLREVRLEAERVAPDGTRSPQETFVMADPFLLPVGICRTAGHWYVTSLGAETCRLGPVGAPVQGCEQELAPGTRCLTDMQPLHDLRAVVADPAPRERPRPAGEWTAVEPWLQRTASGLQGRVSWVSSQGIRLEDAGDGTFLKREWKDPWEAEEHGLLPKTHTRVVRVDAELKELSAPGWVEGAEVSAFTLDTGSEVVLVGADGVVRARFDRRTFERLDRPPASQAIWDQLSSAGHVQPLASGLVLSVLGLPLVPVGALALLRRPSAPVWLLVASGVWLFVSLASALGLMSRWW